MPEKQKRVKFRLQLPRFPPAVQPVAPTGFMSGRPSTTPPRNSQRPESLAASSRALACIHLRSAQGILASPTLCHAFAHGRRARLQALPLRESQASISDPGKAGGHEGTSGMAVSPVVRMPPRGELGLRVTGLRWGCFHFPVELGFLSDTKWYKWLRVSLPGKISNVISLVATRIHFVPPQAFIS